MDSTVVDLANSARNSRRELTKANNYPTSKLIIGGFVNGARLPRRSVLLLRLLQLQHRRLTHRPRRLMDFGLEVRQRSHRGNCWVSIGCGFDHVDELLPAASASTRCKDPAAANGETGRRDCRVYNREIPRERSMNGSLSGLMKDERYYT